MLQMRFAQRNSDKMRFSTAFSRSQYLLTSTITYYRLTGGEQHDNIILDGLVSNLSPLRNNMRDEIPGLLGIIGLTAAVIGTCGVIAIQSLTLTPLIIGGAAIVVSVWAVQAINKR